VAVPFGRKTTTVFGRDHHNQNAAPGWGESLLSTIDLFISVRRRT